MANEPVTRGHDAERTCANCGKTFKSDGAWYAKHAMSCDGTPATSGRIAARDGHVERTPPAARKPRKAARRAVQRRKPKRTGRELALVEPKALVIPVGASARVTFLGQLHVMRDQIDGAITAVEALG